MAFVSKREWTLTILLYVVIHAEDIGHSQYPKHTLCLASLGSPTMPIWLMLHLSVGGNDNSSVCGTCQYPCMDLNHSSVCGHTCRKYTSQPASKACIVLSITRCTYHVNMIDVELVNKREWTLTILLYVLIHAENIGHSQHPKHALCLASLGAPTMPIWLMWHLSVTGNGL